MLDSGEFQAKFREKANILLSKWLLRPAESGLACIKGLFISCNEETEGKREASEEHQTRATVKRPDYQTGAFPRRACLVLLARFALDVTRLTNAKK